VVDLSPRLLLDRYVVKAFRYSLISVANTLATVPLLILLYQGFHWSGWLSNVVAVAVLTPPVYWANRAWVWNKRTAHSMTREILPFWGMAALGLVLSTIAVATVDQYTHSAYVIALASVAAFGLLWVAKFLVLEHVMFGDHTQGAPASVRASEVTS
jgi:putative flippase GtrA